MCDHEHFQSYVDVNRLTRSDDGYRPPSEAEVVGFSADIQIICRDCEEMFAFIGVPAGVDSGRPMTSVLGTELRAPIRPVGTPR